ncbi:MAG: aldehyde-activating protein [SAR86 cluster bacterium]|uniref:Aldehyde-activating protein n=1 Tax=SAR86 cluster bacterium TaxID=2030880 RepID=A0A2A5AUJ4_9GAMM|nr:MAG: aldehyde-activating protein [SAR86 cluster bacterium]
MSEERTGSGGCLCGEVQFTAENMGNTLGACHCTVCRKWGGGPFMEVDCGQNVSFKGEEHISVFNSSDWAERGFCKQCGTHLFYRLKESRAHMMPVGLFDDASGLVFNQQVFIDEKPSYYCFSNETKELTGAELFAKFTSGSD